MTVQGQILLVKIFKKNPPRNSWEISLWNLGKFRPLKIFNSVEFQISKKAKLTLMLWPLKQAIIRENRWSLSKVMDYLVRPSIAGNAKKM